MCLAGRLKKEREGWRFDSIEVDIAGWWASAYPIIEQIATTTTAAIGIVAVARAPFKFIKWFREKVQSSSSYHGTEANWIQKVLFQDCWNISELSKTLSISNEDSKQLLRGFGFSWDKSKMLYVSSELTKKLREISGVRYQTRK